MNGADRAPGDELTTEQTTTAGGQAARESGRQQQPQGQDAVAPGQLPPADADIIPGEVVGEGDGPAAGRDTVADNRADSSGSAGEGVTGSAPAGGSITGPRPTDDGAIGAGPASESDAGSRLPGHGVAGAHPGGDGPSGDGPGGDGLDDEDAFDDDLLDEDVFDEDVFDDQVLIEDEDDDAAGAAGAGAAGGMDDGGLGGDPPPHVHMLEGEELRAMVMRWREIQAGFVDQPRAAVADADALVAELMQRLARSLADERARLESQWAGVGDVSTEDLRQGLRRYRSFFERLLAA